MAHIQSDISDEFSDRLKNFLMQAAAVLDPFSLEDTTGYGTTITVTPKTGPRVSMHRFCWCDQEICPHCTAWTEELSGLDEASRAATLDAWKSAGHVEGHGAPNFRFDSPEITASVWWYKYIGRGMETDLDEDRLAVLDRRFQAWATLARLDIAQASLARWCTPDDLRLDAASCSVLRKSFAARIAQMRDPENDEDVSIDVVIEDIRMALRALQKQGYAAAQCRTMEAALDRADVKRSEDDLPEDLVGAFAPAYRLERVLFNGGHFPTNEDLDCGVAVPVAETDDAPS